MEGLGGFRRLGASGSGFWPYQARGSGLDKRIKEAGAGTRW